MTRRSHRGSRARQSRGNIGPRRGLLLLGLVALVGCATTPLPPPAPSYESYRVGAPDSLLVTVLPEPVLQETVVVRPDGMITVQLIGDIPAAGRTPDEIAAEVQSRIGKFKRGARATVAVAGALSSAVTVLGEVRSPSSFPIPKFMRVAEALGMVGGITRFGNDDSIRIVRNRSGSTSVHRVDLAAIHGGDLSTNVQLYGGDIIYVPPSGWARVGYAVQAVLFPLQPFLGVATSAAGSAITR